MSKDYFSDIDTESEGLPQRTGTDQADQGAEKSIRNISVSPRRSAMTQRMIPEPRNSVRQVAPVRPRNLRTRLFVWVAAGFAVLAVAVVGIVLLSSKTTIEITPRTHQITFDPSTQFTAYPEGDPLATGIRYTLQNFELEDSTTVPATGTEKAEERASGTITVYNAYSASSVRLIKNTRFEAPNGLVFRIPSSVDIPAKKGATPGEVTVTVFADQPGADYNLGPTDKFTVPGLKTTPDMYNGVYARSLSPFSGGFVGEKPAIAPQALEAARSEIRARLQSKITESIEKTEGGFAFSALANIEYISLPTISDPAGGAKVTEKAIVQLPVFPRDTFAQSIAQAVSADASDTSVTLVPRDQFSAARVGSATELGKTPITFSLTGAALVVWNVDVDAVKQSLAGKEQDAFKPIIATFVGIKDATAHIAPFWSSHFPSNPSSIVVTLVDPTKRQ